MSDTVGVSRRTDGSFDVEVHHGGAVTRHVVRVPPGLAAELGRSGVGDERLVEESFAFLLEREPAASILRSFGLEVIEQYFPEYRREMARRLA
jgi:L-2-hydroxyglutarate oxidase LhgO